MDGNMHTTLHDFYMDDSIPFVLSDFHKSAWGKQWNPLSVIQVRATPPGAPQLDQTDADDSVVHISASVELGVPSVQNYVCYDDLHKVANALGWEMPFDGVLVVRPEYDQIIQRMMEGDLDHNLVVTGHPGIGKSMFLLYLLFWRMERRLPTAIQTRVAKYIIFDGDGSIVVRATDEHAQLRLKKCWALSDSNSEVNGPCTDFLFRADRIIQTAPPQPSRWRSWKKHRRAALVIMELPNALDVVAVVRALRPRDRNSPTKTLELLDRWGPSICTIMSLLEGKKDSDELTSAVETQAQALCASADTTWTLYLPFADGLPVCSLDSPFCDLLFLRPLRVRCTMNELLEDGAFVIRNVGNDHIVEYRGVPSCIVPTDYLRDILEAHRTDSSADLPLSVFKTLSNGDYDHSLS